MVRTFVNVTMYPSTTIINFKKSIKTSIWKLLGTVSRETETTLSTPKPEGPEVGEVPCMTEQGELTEKIP
jgi:hypothetical protein